MYYISMINRYKIILTVILIHQIHVKHKETSFELLINRYRTLKNRAIMSILRTYRLWNRWSMLICKFFIPIQIFNHHENLIYLWISYAKTKSKGSVSSFRRINMSILRGHDSVVCLTNHLKSPFYPYPVRKPSLPVSDLSLQKSEL